MFILTVAIQIQSFGKRKNIPYYELFIYKEHFVVQKEFVISGDNIKFWQMITVKKNLN